VLPNLGARETFSSITKALPILAFVAVLPLPLLLKLLSPVTTRDLAKPPVDDAGTPE